MYRYGMTDGFQERMDRIEQEAMAAAHERAARKAERARRRRRYMEANSRPVEQVWADAEVHRAAVIASMTPAYYDAGVDRLKAATAEGMHYTPTYRRRDYATHPTI